MFSSPSRPTHGGGEEEEGLLFASPPLLLHSDGGAGRAPKQRRIITSSSSSSGGKAMRTVGTTTNITTSTTTMSQASSNAAPSALESPHQNSLSLSNRKKGAKKVDVASPPQSSEGYGRPPMLELVQSQTKRKKRSSRRVDSEVSHKSLSKSLEEVSVPVAPRDAPSMCLDCALSSLRGLPLVPSPQFPFDFVLAQRCAQYIAASGRCRAGCTSDVISGEAALPSCDCLSDWNAILWAHLVMHSSTVQETKADVVTLSHTFTGTISSIHETMKTAFLAFLKVHILAPLEASSCPPSASSTSTSTSKPAEAAAAKGGTCGSAAAVPAARLLELCCWLSTSAAMRVEFLASAKSDFVTRSLCSALNGSVKDVQIVSFAVACVILIAIEQPERVCLGILSEANSLQFVRLLLNRCVYNGAAEPHSALEFPRFASENCDDLTERSTEEEEAVAVWVGRLRVMLRPPPPRMSVDAATTGPRVVAVGGVGLSKDGLAALMALEHLLRCDKVTRKHGGPIVQEVLVFMQKWWPRVELAVGAAAGAGAAPRGDNNSSSSCSNNNNPSGTSAALLTIATIANLAADRRNQEPLFEQILEYLDSKLLGSDETNTSTSLIGLLQWGDRNLVASGAALIGSALERAATSQAHHNIHHISIPQGALESLLDEVLRLITAATEASESRMGDTASSVVTLTVCYEYIRIVKAALRLHRAAGGWAWGLSVPRLPALLAATAIATSATATTTAAAAAAAFRTTASRSGADTPAPRAHIRFLSSCVECIWRCTMQSGGPDAACDSNSVEAALDTVLSKPFISEDDIMQLQLSGDDCLHDDDARQFQEWFQHIIDKRRKSKTVEHHLGQSSDSFDKDKSVDRESIGGSSRRGDSYYPAAAASTVSSPTLVLDTTTTMTTTSPGEPTLSGHSPRNSYCTTEAVALQGSPPMIHNFDGEASFCYSPAESRGGGGGGEGRMDEISPIIQTAPPSFNNNNRESSEMDIKALEMQFAEALEIGGRASNAPRISDCGDGIADLRDEIQAYDVDADRTIASAKLQAENSALRAELCAARRHIAELVASSTVLKESVIEGSMRSEALERRCEEQSEVISTSYAKLVAVVAELESSRAKAALSEAVAASAAEEATRAALRESEASLRSSRSEAAAADFLRQLEVRSREALQLRTDFGAAKTRLIDEERRTAALESTCSDLHRELSSKNDLIVHMNTRLADTEGVVADLNGMVARLASDLEHARGETDALRRSEAALMEQSAQMAIKLSRVKSRRDDFKAMLCLEKAEADQLRSSLKACESNAAALEALNADLSASLQTSREEVATSRQLADELAIEAAKHRDVIMYINRISSESSSKPVS